MGPRTSMDDTESRKSCTYWDLNSKPSDVQPVASHYTDCAIPAPKEYDFFTNVQVGFWTLIYWQFIYCVSVYILATENQVFTLSLSSCYIFISKVSFTLWPVVGDGEIKDKSLLTPVLLLCSTAVLIKLKYNFNTRISKIWPKTNYTGSLQHGSDLILMGNKCMSCKYNNVNC
jgi:hypothetical protein